MENTVQQVPVQKKNSSTGLKVACGCGIGCLVLLIILGVGGCWAVRWGMNKVQEMAAEFEEQGYTQVNGQQIDVLEPVTEETLYMGQIVKLMADCQTNVAIVAQVGEVHKHVAGDVYFRGQVLTVQPDAVIEGDLDVSAQAVQIYGEVKGELKGVYQTLDRKGTQTVAE